jgi:hypothetical protein
MVVVCIASDNNGTNGVDSVSSVTDSKSHTYTRRVSQNRDPGAAAAGASINIYTALVTTAMTTSDVVTTNFSPNTTSKAVVIWEVAPGAGQTPIYVTNGGTTGDKDPALTSTSIGSGDAVIYAIAAESRATLTGDSDTTRGSWSALYTSVADTGTGGTSMRVGSQHKVVNATGTQAWSGTINDCDFALAYIILNPAGGAATVSRTATGSGTGTQTATGSIVAPSVVSRAATGSGTGSQNAVGVKTKLRVARGIGFSAISAQPSSLNSALTSINATTFWIAQTFAGRGSVLDSIRLNMNENGSAGDTVVVVDIYALTGTLASGTPTGSVLATSGNVTIPTSAVGQPTFFPFAGANRITLSNAVNYAFVIRYVSGTNGYNIRFNTDTDLTAGAYVSSSNSGGSWTSLGAARELIYGVYGVDATRLVTKIRTATGSGTGTQTAVGAKFTATVYNRTATSSGVGSSSVLSGVLKELSLYSFSEPVKSGYDFYEYNPIPTNNGYWGILTRIS